MVTDSRMLITSLMGESYSRSLTASQHSTLEYPDYRIFSTQKGLSA